MENLQNQFLLNHPGILKARIQTMLGARALQNGLGNELDTGRKKGSAVLFLVGNLAGSVNNHPEISLILNKRSLKVRQPGDLCFPGGSLALKWDRLLAVLLRLPFSPLKRWTGWSSWHRKRNGQTKDLALLLAAGLREAWEEMRLNPFSMDFLGPLPPQQLVIFDRFIHPLAGWLVRSDYPSFRINWEVQRIVYIPFRRLLDPGRYGRFRPRIKSMDENNWKYLHNEYLPCFIHQDVHGRDLLWGASYRIVQDFLKLVFDFKAPETNCLPEVTWLLDPTYPKGSPL